MMNQQTAHPMLAKSDHDELARQDFVFTMKQFVSDTLAVGGRRSTRGASSRRWRSDTGGPPTGTKSVVAWRASRTTR